jgi:hypothetical protein
VVQAGTESFLVVGRGTRTIKKVLIGVNGLNTKDFKLYDVVFVEGFYINIISEVRLGKNKV